MLLPRSMTLPALSITATIKAPVQVVRWQSLRLVRLVKALRKRLHAARLRRYEARAWAWFAAGSC